MAVRGEWDGGGDGLLNAPASSNCPEGMLNALNNNLDSTRFSNLRRDLPVHHPSLIDSIGRFPRERVRKANRIDDPGFMAMAHDALVTPTSREIVISGQKRQE